jgi:hypothetical protein
MSMANPARPVPGVHDIGRRPRFELGHHRITWIPLVLLIATVGVVTRSHLPGWWIGPPAAWFLAISLLAGWRWSMDPRTWPGDPILRGRNPNRCALLIEVRAADAEHAPTLLRALALRGVGCTVFVAPGVELGDALDGHEPATLLASVGVVRNYWRPDGLRPRAGTPGRLCGHTIRLGPRSPPLDASRVVGTDLVVVPAGVPPDLLLGWIDEWATRAVFAGTVSAAILPPG